MRKLKMGIIGAGMAFEKLHYPAYEMLSDRYEIVALCDPEKSQLDKWKNILKLKEQDLYTDYKEIITRSDIDAFDIMVPIELNYEVTKEVSKAGKPIICEKPLAPNIEEAQRARDMDQRFGIPIMIAENYRHNEEVKLIRDMVTGRKVGDILYFIWNHFDDFPRKMPTAKFQGRDWRQHPEYPGGAFLDTGVHDIAALRFIFGDAQEVQSFGRKQQEDFAPYSVMTTNIRFKNGIIGNYTFFAAGKEAQTPPTGFRIYGSQGMIFLESRDCGRIQVTYNDGQSETIPYIPQRGYYNELLNFYNSLMGTEKIEVTPEVEYGDAMMMFTMLKSAKEGKLLPVDERFHVKATKIPPF